VRGVLKALWAQAAQVRVRQNKKRLRVCETVALGDKRFVTIIQVDDKQFLVGGASNSVSLLAQLDKPAEFSSVLQSRIGEVSG
jgi:flagellar biogenesis protein FliO